MKRAEPAGRATLAPVLGWMDDRARRLRTALVGRSGRPGELDDVALRRQLDAVASSEGRPRGAPTPLVRAVATALEAVGSQRLGARWWVRALRSAPHDPERWVGLARCLQSTGGPGPTMVTTVGWTLGAIASSESLDFALQRAADLGAGEALVVATQRAIDAGHLDRALELSRDATRRSPSSASAWTARARTLATRAQRAGGLMPNDVVAVREAWEHALAAGGTDARPARVHLVRHCIRFREWERAFAVADPDVASVPTSVDEVRACIHDPSFAPSADWWYVAWWWMQSAGHVREGWQARRREAESRLPAAVSPTGSIAAVRAGVQSLVVLDRLDEALDLARRACRVPDRRGVLRRLRADVLLRTGDPRALADWARSHSTGLPPGAEQSFHELVRGRRIAVVGPHATDEERRCFAQSCDVMIDTKQLGSNGARAASSAVSYYADTTAALFAAPVLRQLVAGRLDLAVLRPTAVGIELAEHPQVRITPTEDSLSLGVSHFAIARIVYDVLRYSPRSITLVGVDLFTSSTAYPESYRHDRQHYLDTGFAPVLPRFNHDVADDFLMLSRLHRCGVLDADETTGNLLETSFDEYLSMVDGATQATAGRQ